MTARHDTGVAEAPERPVVPALWDVAAVSHPALDTQREHICIVEPAGRILGVNVAWRQFSIACDADPRRSCEGANYLDAVRAAGNDKGAREFLAGFERVVSGDADRFELEYSCHGGGEQRWFRVLVTPYPGSGPMRLVITHENITSLHLAERSMRINQLSIDRAALSILRVDEHGRLVYVNDATCLMLSRSRADLLGLSIEDIQPDLFGGWKAHWRELEEKGSLSRETHYESGNGAFIPVKVSSQFIRFDGESFAVSYAKDISQRQQAEHDVHRLVNFDGLTGLPNRNLLLDRLAQSIHAWSGRNQAVAVLFVDLDQFRLLNDSLGHAAGDAVLLSAAQRLACTASSAETIARMGGDEFAVVMAGDAATLEGEVVNLASRLLDAFSLPMSVAGREIYISCSIGVALHPRDGKDPETLLRHADAAVHSAKQAGRNNVQFFRPESNALAREWLMLETDLRNAIAGNELELVFQPQVDLAGGGVVAVEALLRWNHPTLGPVSPSRIIPLAEQTGLIGQLGLWVLRTACQQCARWHDQGLPKVRVAVNVSAQQVRDGRFVETVQETLEHTGLQPRYLELELTESVFIDEPGRVIDDFHALRRLGVRLSLDDFGTGYSSLSYLARCPVDTVKIDRSFIHQAGEVPLEASIIRAIIHMVHALDMEVVAEGVETAGQLALLEAYRCDTIQGYVFSKPIGAKAIETMLKEGRQLAPVSEHITGRRRTLLIVDDEQSILSALRRLLRRDGYEIVTATSGTEALAMLARGRVDVIISDQRMPGMTGVEFLRRAKEISPDTIRIVLSGFTELQSITDAINEGAIYKFFTKPWDDQQLRSNIAEAFRSKELIDDNTRLENALRCANRNLETVNLELQAVLEGQRQALARGETSLDVTREVIDCIPLPVLGLDEEGSIVFTNREAALHLDGIAASLGYASGEDLLPVLRAAVEAAPGSSAPIDVNGKGFRAVVRPLGASSTGRGNVIVLVPEELA